MGRSRPRRMPSTERRERSLSPSFMGTLLLRCAICILQSATSQDENLAKTFRSVLWLIRGLALRVGGFQDECSCDQQACCGVGPDHGRSVDHKAVDEPQNDAR